MWIRRLEVAHWRGLTYALEGLAPGLNLIAGPNEAGKSRLVQALRFGLFESSRGKSEHKRALATWGVDPDRPRVAVDFTLRGVDWHLEKVFLGTGCNTQLRSANRTLDGEAAEAHLAELLGVAPGKTTELKPEERGLWALLWVEQGASREEPRHSTTSQTQILDLLAAEIGEAAAGTFGQATLQLARERYELFYGGPEQAPRPLKRLTEPEIAVAELRRRLDAAIERRDAVVHAAAALAATRAHERELAGRVAGAEAHLAEVATRHEAARNLGHRLEVAEGDARLAERVRDEAFARQQAGAELDAEAERLDHEIASAAAALTREEAVRDTLQAGLAESARRVADTENRLAGVAERVATLRERERRVRVREELTLLRTRLTEARTVDERITTLREALAGLPALGQREVDALRQAEATRNTARARLDGASASLTLTARRPLTVDGDPLDAAQVRHVLIEDDRRIEIEGLVSISVSPGGGEIVKLRDGLRDADRALTALRARLGVADAAAGEAIAQQRREHEIEIAQAGETLARLAPAGIDELGRQVAEHAVVLVPDTGTAAGADDERLDPAALEAAEAESRALGSELHSLRRAREDALERLTQVRELLAGLGQRLGDARAARTRAATRRGELPDGAVLADAVAAAQRAYGERIAACDAARGAFEASGGKALELDLEQARQALQQLNELHRRTGLERSELEGRLKAGSNEALHEEVLDLVAELDTAETRLSRVRREAATARRLYEVLAAEYKAAQERLTQPVVERIRPYLADLFPGSEVWIDEDLTLRGLRSAHTDEAFAELSGGAREQLSLLVRIGLAEVVGAQESWPLVLDDVLVNTDAARIRRMQRALFHAGRKMQILLFTCHGALFDTLGPEAWLELPPPARQGTAAASAQ